jgi:predicted PurR-regulated permease PerM
MTFPSGHQGISRAFILLVFCFLLVIALKMTSYLVTILVVSLVLGMLALPLVDRLRKRGIPDVLAVSVVTGIALFLLVILAALTVFGFSTLMRDLPLYQVELNLRIAEIEGTLSGYGLSGLLVTAPAPDLKYVVDLVISSAISVGDLVLYLFFIGVTTFFLLLELPRLPERLNRIPAFRGEKLSEITRMSRYMIGFVIVRTETNAVHGLLFGSTLFLMGVHAALLWGVLTFVLGYIPYIGLILAAIPAIFFAWLQFGWWGAAAVIALVCILNLVVENPVFSYFAARKFRIPALVVILSVIIWGWILGIAGMVFAVPITLGILILFQCSDELAWVNTLLGVDQLFVEDPDKEPPGG